ncbi:MAG: ribbon-helix-helix domain-containing protein [Nitrososphaerota archaeon]|jgi:metal-responsive CopG/Arc/MetJ family transcriptional regulator|nr:ribbon-helix-helix domain-containing protein [Nitrososphaerota archaeon]
MTHENFKGLSLNKHLVDEVENFIEQTHMYRSVSEFVSEATRLRLEQLRRKSPITEA